MIPGTFPGEQHSAEETGRNHKDGKPQRFHQVKLAVLLKILFHDTKRNKPVINICLLNDLKLQIFYAATPAPGNNSARYAAPL